MSFYCDVFRNSAYGCKFLGNKASISHLYCYYYYYYYFYLYYYQYFYHYYY